MDNEISAILVDDHEIFRCGLRLTLDKLLNVKVIGETGNGEELFRLIKKEEPDIVFMDIVLGDENGVALTRKLKAKYPLIYVVAMTSSEEIRDFKGMVEANAEGFLLKTITEVELKKAIHEILAGRQYFSKEFLIVAKTMFSSHKKASSIRITKREKDILRLICQGLSNQEIADSLGLSYHTVDAHRRSVIHKTGARNTAEMIMVSFKEGLIDPE